jgi:hypothetical protein
MDMVLPLTGATPSATQPLTYKVVIDGVTLPLPPEIGMSDNSVRRAVSAFYPGAETARVERTEKDGIVTITLIKVPGRKGSTDLQCAADEAISSLVSCQGGINPAVKLYLEIKNIGIDKLPPDRQLAVKKQALEVMKEGKRQEGQLEAALSILSRLEPKQAPILIEGF